ncbi:MAG TPA: IS91 family transposase, partial [Firmicutes bacterium]|nr:IS91 family transposase [Bacillota bacterium]
KLKFQTFIDTLYQKEWVVYCKKPFKSPWHVLRYLGRYTHRVAISNQRIVGLDNDQVSFQWRDYKDNNKTKLMTLDAPEFIRPFLMHVLPSPF